MVLHHRRDLENIRLAYGSDQPDGSSVISHQACQSSHSEQSSPTHPTEFASRSSRLRPQALSARAHDCSGRDVAQVLVGKSMYASPRTSVESTTSSTHGEDDETEPPHEYKVPKLVVQQHESHAIPATPTDFSDLFPSGRRLDISHDDATTDGNMNLRVDTQVASRGKSYPITLFHLRLHDLKTREFSLRRYCRDSGREVCHSTNKPKPHDGKRPVLQRSLSNAITRVRSLSDSRTPTFLNLKRHDSGYASMHSLDDRPVTPGHEPSAQPPASPNTVRLEFSNYAQTDVKRISSKGHKRYEFAYWGNSYAWKQTVKKDGTSRRVCYNLTKTGSDQVVARVLAIKQDQIQVEEERSKGGWIPPCTLRIVDEDTIDGQNKDIADVVVATGLLALVDDSIRTRFHSKHTKQLLLPKLNIGVEYVGPKRLINQIFRRNSSSSSRTSQSYSISRPSSSGTCAVQRHPTVRESEHTTL